MKQTTKTLATMGGLALLALAIAFGAAWVGKDEEQKTQAKEKSEKLLDLDKAQAREVVLTKAGKQVADLKRDDDKEPWKIVRPVQTLADGSVVNALVDKLAGLKEKSELEGMDPKLAGLGDEAKVNLSVAVTDAAGKTQTLLFGVENPFDQTIYVKRAGDPVVRMIAKAEKTPLDKELFDLRDKRVAQLDEAAGVTKLTVLPEAASAIGAAKGGPKNRPGANANGAVALAGAGTFAFTLEHQGASWKLTQPETGAADNTVADHLVSAIKGLRATKIASEAADDKALAQYGLASPLETLTLDVTPVGKEVFVRKLFIGQPAPSGGSVSVKTYAKRDDSLTVYEVDGQIVKDLNKSLFDLQDKTAMKFDREAVRRIEVAQAGKDTIVVTRKREAVGDAGTAEETFAVTAPQAGAAKKWKASSLLVELTNLKATAFGDEKLDAKPDAKTLAQRGLDKPRTVTLFGEGDTVLARLLIGGAADARPDSKNDAKASAKPGAKPDHAKKLWVLVDAGGVGPHRAIEVESSGLSDIPQAVQDILEPPKPQAVPEQLKADTPAPFVPHASNK